jgi:hypothetical protein
MSEWPEISGRLKTALNGHAFTFADRLKPALRLASEQLEWLSPAVMGNTDRGFVSSLATYVPRGTWLIVLANPRKVLTIHAWKPPEGSRLDLLDDCVSYARKTFQEPKQEEVLALTNTIITKFGGKPGKPNRAMQPGMIAALVGLLCSQQDIEQLANGIETAVSYNVCPLHVGLIGNGAIKSTICGVWPLVLPFVPYVDGLFPE